MRMGILAYLILEEIKVSKTKEVQVEMEEICLESLVRAKSYTDTIEKMITKASTICGADDKSVFINMASSIYNSMCYTWGHPEEDDR